MRSVSKLKAQVELEQAIINGKCNHDNAFEYYLKNIFKFSKNKIRMVKYYRIYNKNEKISLIDILNKFK